jgi:hypothetical protein
MVAMLVPWQDVLLPAVVLWIVAGAVIGLAAWLHRHHEGRTAVVALLCVGIVLVALSAPIAVMAHRQYVAINTFTYGYDLAVHSNGTTGDAIIVPIPGEEALVSGLRVLSGVANWSIVETRHGKGLYVAFNGTASVEARYSAFGPSRFDYNDTPTMRENASYYEADVWIYHATTSEVRIELSIEGCRLSAYPTDGWRTYHMECVPAP